MNNYYKVFLFFLTTCSLSAWCLIDTPVVVHYSDSQIIKIMIEANEDTLTISQTARKKSELIDVRDFASLLIEFHSQNLLKCKSIAKAENITPKFSPTVAKLKVKKQMAMANFKPRKGYFFDKAYIKNQVKFHQSLLDYLDEKLIPESKNKRLKDFLIETRQTVRGHLDKATKLKGLFVE